MRTVAYRAGALKPVISISGDGGIEAALGRILAGWGLAPVAPDAVQDAPRLVVEQVADGWLCSGEAFGETVTYRDPVATGCGIVAALFKAQTFADRQGLCLHAAGVRFGDGAVLLTGAYRSGKSVLTAACAAAGRQVFSDDIVPLVHGATAVRAPGLALRLRLPLPEGLGATVRFVQEHAAIESSRYIYVRPPEALLARHGAEAPIRGLVAIERRQEGPARIARMAPADALGEVIRRNFAQDVPARRIVDTLDRLVTGTPCLRLVYADAGEAASLMQRVFAGAEHVPEMPSQAAPAPSRRRKAAARASILVPDAAMLGRHPGAGMRERGGELFLTDPDDLAIHGLNATGAAVWRLIEDPVPFGEIVETFAAAFPDLAREDLRNDLAALALDLVAKGLARLEEGTRGRGFRRDMETPPVGFGPPADPGGAILR